MKNIADFLALALLRAFFLLVNCFPLSLRLKIMEALLRLVVLLKPKYERISKENLLLAFPEKDQGWRDDIYQKSFSSLARFLVDAMRLRSIDKDWIDKHIEIDNREEFIHIADPTLSPGLLVASGHLGSFELLAYAFCLISHPLSFVVRNFKSERIDSWWNGIRESNGNIVIDRKGAYRNILRTLRAGRTVGILFDQNIKRGDAIFVDWFGKPAATTRALGLAAVQNHSPLIAASLLYLGQDKYRLVWESVRVEDIYHNDGLDRDEKIHLITQRATDTYVAMIREAPEAWFWMHRRWKTRPTAEEEAQEKLQVSSKEKLCAESSAQS